MKILLLLLAACASPLPTTSVPQRPTPWCAFAGLNSREVVMTCAETRLTCERAVSIAKQFGPIGGVTSVDDCIYSGAP